MVISHKHKYVFISRGRTGSSAVYKELISHYGGKAVLFKHSSYNDFKKLAGRSFKDYFAFAGIRDPLDELVSKFLRLKNNHREAYFNPKRVIRQKMRGTGRGLRQFEYIRETGADFARYFTYFYKTPYINIMELDNDRFDHIIRYENIQEGFSEVLRKLGMKQVRPLPLKNRTKRGEGDKHFLEYYTPDIRRQVIHVMGPMMEFLGYSFPEDWGECRVPVRDRILFNFKRRAALGYFYFFYFNPHKKIPFNISKEEISGKAP